VRDLLLGRRPKDYDIATAARPPQVKRTFPRNCRIIGRRFKLAHLHFHNNTKILECSTFRRSPQNDSQPGDGDQELAESQDLLITQDNEFGTAHEDALRRDFTVNALLLDPTRDLILDYTQGLADLEARVIRTIGDPRVRFREDPIRILRAAKFAGRLGFTIEPETFAAMAETSGDLVRSAPPRVYEEILRLLRGGHALDSFQMLRDVGALQHLVPVLAEFLAKARHDERVQFWRLLEALDHRILDTETVPCNAVLLGVLLVGPVLARVERALGRSASSIAEELLSQFCHDLRLPRRDAGCLKRICGVQHRFLQDDDSKRFRIAGFVHGPYFAEAFELFELRMQALGQHVGAVARWRELGEDLGEPTDADLPASLFDGDGGETMPRVGSGSLAESHDGFDDDENENENENDDHEDTEATPRAAASERSERRAAGPRRQRREAAPSEPEAEDFQAPQHLDDMPPDALPRGARGADAMAWDADAEAEADLRPWSRAGKPPQSREAREARAPQSREARRHLTPGSSPEDTSSAEFARSEAEEADGERDGPGADMESPPAADDQTGRRRRRRRRRRGRGQDAPDDSAHGPHFEPAGPHADAAVQVSSQIQGSQQIQGPSLDAGIDAATQFSQQDLGDDEELPPVPATAGPDADDGEDGEIEFQAPEEFSHGPEDGVPPADHTAASATHPGADMAPDDSEPGDNEPGDNEPGDNEPGDNEPGDNEDAEGDPQDPQGSAPGVAREGRRRRRRRGRRGSAREDRFPPSEAPQPHGDALPHGERTKTLRQDGLSADRGFAPDRGAPARPVAPVRAPVRPTAAHGDALESWPATGDEPEGVPGHEDNRDGPHAPESASPDTASDSEGRGRRRRRRRRGRGDGQEAAQGQQALPNQERAEPQRARPELARPEPRGQRQERPQGRGQQQGQQQGQQRVQRQQQQQQRGQQQPRGPQRQQQQQRGPDGKPRHGQHDHKQPRDVAVVPRHRDRRGKVDVIEPTPLDLTAFDVELDPKRVPTFGSIVEGGNRPKKRSPRVPEDGVDDYRPPPPPGSDAPPVPPPPTSDQDSPDTFGDW